MNVTKLKIKIKEVTEETRELTIEERCLNLVTVALVPGCSKECRAEASAKLDSIGFVSYQGTLGKFRTVTIRDATPKEIIAWHCLESYKECDRVDDTCYACPLNVTGGICIPRKCEERSKKVLEGKEVILLVIEE
jgi:hypothetical protein